MKKEFVSGLPVWASIFDGHSRIERRVYVDENGERFVKINGNFVDMDWVYMRWDASISF